MRLNLATLPAHLRQRFLKGVAYRQVFSTPQGKEVLEDLMRFCGLGGEIHVPGDPHETAYNAGKRRVGLRIASFLGFDELAVTKQLARASSSITERTDE